MKYCINRFIDTGKELAKKINAKCDKNDQELIKDFRKIIETQDYCCQDLKEFYNSYEKLIVEKNCCDLCKEFIENCKEFTEDLKKIIEKIKENYCNDLKEFHKSCQKFIAEREK